MRIAPWGFALGIVFSFAVHADGSAFAKHLLLDGRVTREVAGARLALGEAAKHPANPLFGEDRPWEVRFDNLYANVVFDAAAQEYRCWYNPFVVDERTTSTPPEKRGSVNYIAVKPNAREMGVCLAVSKDGLSWSKPELGLVDFNGNSNNNLVARGPHGAGVFDDAHATDPARRFKMFFRGEHDMGVACSRDGVAWSPPVPCPEIAAAGDTHNNALWSPEWNAYVGFTRLWNNERKTRQVGWTHSADFEHWSKAEVVLEGTDPALQVYAMPVFRYAGLYLGLPMIFDTRADRVHAELAWSPDSREWHRVCPGTSFIANGEQPGDYDWGCVYAAANPVLGPDGIRCYYGASDGPHTSWRKGYLCLATLGPDRFAGYEPAEKEQPGSVTTAPFRFSEPLRITADVGEGGHIDVCLLDASGRELRHGRPVTHTVTSGDVAWEQGNPGDVQEGRLRFTIAKARLYAFEVRGQRME